MMKRSKQLIITILCMLFSAALSVPCASAADTVSDGLYPDYSRKGAPELAAELAKKAKDAEGVRVAVDENGQGVFSDLTLGLYLIVQDTPAEGFEPIRSFLVTVPMRDGDKLIYDVVANPKVSVSYKQCTLELPVEKTIEKKPGLPIHQQSSPSA